MPTNHMGSATTLHTQQQQICWKLVTSTTWPLWIHWSVLVTKSRYTPCCDHSSNRCWASSLWCPWCSWWSGSVLNTQNGMNAWKVSPLGEVKWLQRESYKEDMNEDNKEKIKRHKQEMRVRDKNERNDQTAAFTLRAGHLIKTKMNAIVVPQGTRQHDLHRSNNCFLNCFAEPHILSLRLTFNEDGESWGIL